MSAKEPALKKSRSSAVKILNSLTKSWEYSAPGAVMRFSTASVATKSSGPALRCNLFCSHRHKKSARLHRQTSPVAYAVNLSAVLCTAGARLVTW